MHIDRPGADPTPFGSYPADDVTFVLKDLSHVELEAPLEDREEAIQSGRHYSEMLPIEYRPTERGTAGSSSVAPSGVADVVAGSSEASSTESVGLSEGGALGAGVVIACSDRW